MRFLHAYCGGELPNEVTRVEFEMRADLLKRRLGTTDVREVLGRLGELSHYLTHDWFRFEAKEVDRENRQQGRKDKDGEFVHPLWKQVQQVAIVALNAQPGVPPTKESREKCVTTRAKRMANQAVSTAVAVRDHRPDLSDGEVWYEVLEQLFDAIGVVLDAHLVESVIRKRAYDPMPANEPLASHVMARVPQYEVLAESIAIARRRQAVAENTPF